MTKIKVILGSTRPNRFGPQVAQWFMELAKNQKDATFELVDLQNINLPLLDEPVPALMHQYSKEHTKAWAKIVGEADGFVVITGEYNFGVPAALKNAFDFVNLEWNYKPIAFVSYGSTGAGVRAVEHLRGTAAELRMYDLRDHVAIQNYWTQMDENGTFEASGIQIEGAQKVLEAIVFWAKQMQPGREKLLASSAQK